MSNRVRSEKVYQVKFNSGSTRLYEADQVLMPQNDSLFGPENKRNFILFHVETVEDGWHLVAALDPNEVKWVLRVDNLVP